MCHWAWSQFKHLTHTKGSLPKGGGVERGGGKYLNPCHWQRDSPSSWSCSQIFWKANSRTLPKIMTFKNGDNVFFSVSWPKRLCESVSVVLTKYSFNKFTGCSVAQIQMVVFSMAVLLIVWMHTGKDTLLNCYLFCCLRRNSKTNIRVEHNAFPFFLSSYTIKGFAGVKSIFLNIFPQINFLSVGFREISSVFPLCYISQHDSSVNSTVHHCKYLVPPTPHPSTTYPSWQ